MRDENEIREEFDICVAMMKKTQNNESRVSYNYWYHRFLALEWVLKDGETND